MKTTFTKEQGPAIEEKGHKHHQKITAGSPEGDGQKARHRHPYLFRVMGLLLLVALVVTGAFLMRGRWYTQGPVEIITVNKSNYAFSVFWEVVRAGMDEAIEDYDVSMTFMHPDYEYQTEEQKVVIEEAIEKMPDVIILVASDYDEIGPYAEKILDAGIQLILLDSNVRVPEGAKVPFVGTNSLKAGEYLGNIAKEASGPEEKALLLAHYFGVQTSDDRENGIRKGFGNERIAATYSCDSNENIAYERTMEALKSHEDITVVFGTNENVTIGAAMAIEAMGLQDRVQLYGFDGSERHVEYLEKGVVDYTMIQRPYQMGYLAVVNAVKLGNGEKVDAFVETDFLPISMDTMYDVGYREILFPFLTD